MNVRIRKPLGIALEYLLSAWGKREGINIGGLVAGGNALKSGNIRVGMRLLSVNGAPTEGATLEEVSRFLKNSQGETVDLSVFEPYRVVGKTVCLELQKPLGLELEEDRTSGDVYVTAVHHNGSAHIHSVIEPGMTIRRIGSEDITGRGIPAVQLALKEIETDTFEAEFQLKRQFGKHKRTISERKTENMRYMSVSLRKPLGLVLVPESRVNGTGAQVAEILPESPAKEIQGFVVGTRLKKISGIDVGNYTLDEIQKLIGEIEGGKEIDLNIQLPHRELTEKVEKAVAAGSTPTEKAVELLKLINVTINAPRNLQDYVQAVGDLKNLILGVAFSEARNGVETNSDLVFSLLNSLASSPRLLLPPARPVHSFLCELFDATWLALQQGRRRSRGKDYKGDAAALFADSPVQTEAVHIWRIMWPLSLGIRTTDDSFELREISAEIQKEIESLPDYDQGAHSNEDVIPIKPLSSTNSNMTWAQAQERVFPGRNQSKVDFKRKLLLLLVEEAQLHRYNETSMIWSGLEIDHLTRYIMKSKQKFSPLMESRISKMERNMKRSLEVRKQMFDLAERRREFQITDFQRYSDYWGGKPVSKRSKLVGHFDSTYRENTWLVGA